MAIVKWQPMWPSFWDDSDWPNWGNNDLEVYETEDDVVVKAPVPGLKEDEIKVTFEDGVLRIRGQHEQTEEEKKGKKVIHQEWESMAYNFVTTLPRPVKAGDIKAELKDGILTITAPIAPESKPKLISVSVKK
jgi:HSP20 family protein